MKIFAKSQIKLQSSISYAFVLVAIGVTRLVGGVLKLNVVLEKLRLIQTYLVKSHTQARTHTHKHTQAHSHTNTQIHNRHTADTHKLTYD